MNQFRHYFECDGSDHAWLRCVNCGSIAKVIKTEYDLVDGKGQLKLFSQCSCSGESYRLNKIFLRDSEELFRGVDWQKIKNQIMMERKKGVDETNQN